MNTNGLRSLLGAVLLIALLMLNASAHGSSGDGAFFDSATTKNIAIRGYSDDPIFDENLTIAFIDYRVYYAPGNETRENFIATQEVPKSLFETGLKKEYAGDGIWCYVLHAIIPISIPKDLLDKSTDVFLLIGSEGQHAATLEHI